MKNTTRNTMKKKFIATALFLAGAMTAGAQTYTTLGIGINPPQATLHVHSNEIVQIGSGITPDPGIVPEGMNGINTIFLHDYKTTFRMTNTNTSTNGFVVEQSNLDVKLSQLEDGNLTIYNNGNQMIFTHDGRIGVGALYGSYGFNVNKSSRFAMPVTMAHGLSVTGGVTVHGALSLYGGITANNGLSVSGNMTLSGSLAVGNGFSCDTTGNMTVSGSLAVGNGFSCDATGNMKVKHLRVTTEDWPDYVFGDGYRLRPLVEVEAYVKQHRHLPEVPAAAEVEQEGVDQGELNRVLMQKVEELTLYIIDLQKQIEELKNK